MLGKDYLNIVIDKKVIKRKDLTSSDKLVYGIIQTLADSLKETTATNKYIANEINVSNITVKRSLKTLRDKSLINTIGSNQTRKIVII